MGAFFKRLWTDPAYFTATMRGLVGLFGAAVAMGYVEPIPKEAGGFIMGAAGFLKAGDKNVPTEITVASEPPVRIETPAK